VSAPSELCPVMHGMSAAPPGLCPPVQAPNAGGKSVSAQARKMRRREATRRSLELEKISLVTKITDLELQWKTAELEDRLQAAVARIAAIEADASFVSTHLGAKVGQLEVLTTAVSTELHSAMASHANIIQKLVFEQDEISWSMQVLKNRAEDPQGAKIAQAAKAPTEDWQVSVSCGQSGVELEAKLERLIEEAGKKLDHHVDKLQRRCTDTDLRNKLDELEYRVRLAADVQLGKRCPCVLTADTTSTSQPDWHVTVRHGTEAWLPPGTRCQVKEGLVGILKAAISEQDASCEGVSNHAGPKYSPWNEGQVMQMEKLIAEVAELRNQTQEKADHRLEQLVPFINKAVMAAVDGLATVCDAEFTELKKMILERKPSG